MMHHEATHAAKTGRHPDVVKAVDGCVHQLDRELAHVELLTWADVLDLKARVCMLHCAAGGDAFSPWYRAAIARLSRRAMQINADDALANGLHPLQEDVNTQPLAPPNTGSKAIERAMIPRSRWGYR